MRRSATFILLFAAVLSLASCMSESGINKAKFAELDRAVQDLKSAITSSDPCNVPETLEQRLATGIENVRNRATTKGERDLVAAYTQILITYRDGLLFCRSRAPLANFDFFPKGRIYLSQELGPLAEKYDLPSEKHLYKRTGQYIRSIDGNSIQVIWSRAQAQIKNAENILKYY